MILILENAINWDTLDQAKEMILKGRLLTKKTGVKTLSKFQLYDETNLKQVQDPKVQEYCRERMLTYCQAKELFEYGKGIGQEVFFTPMNLEMMDWIPLLDCNYIKIRFYDRYNKDLCARALDWEKIIFISSDEVFEWGSNVYNLFCVPKYPAKTEDYCGYMEGFQGFSDHTPNLELLKNQLKYPTKCIEYFERHVCLNDDCLERAWASTFQEIEEVLK